MNTRLLARLGRLTLLAALVATAPALAQTAGPAVTVTVTAMGDAASVTKEDVLVRQGDSRRPVVSWVPAGNDQASLDLVLLIDDSLDTGVGTNLDDLQKFIRSLPEGTRVAVAYAQNSNANLRQNLTADREEAAKAVRLPLGMRDTAQSPYLALVDLLGRLPQTQGRRAVLLISDGIDLFRGVSGSSPANNTELQRAIERSQRQNVQVYTLFASGSGRFRRNTFLVGNGQGALSRLALETGGEAYFQGFSTPVSFEPFLKELNQALGQQYLLTFRAAPVEKASYQRVRITTEAPGVELMAPTRVWVPAR
jgi:VWFA-related protein